MLRFVLRRLLLVIPILLGLSLLLFIWIRLLPGSPADALLGQRADPEKIAQLRHQYGLDRPLYDQYWRYLQSLAEGNLGTSIHTQQPITTELRQRFPCTLELALAAGGFALALGIPLGFLTAKYVGRLFDTGGLALSLVGVSVPAFLSALILKYIFAVRLGWLPTVGRQSVLIDSPHPTGLYVLDGIITGHWYAAWDAVKHLLLPAIALGSIPLAVILRITRAAVLDVQNEDYVRTARAKGMPARTVGRSHIMRNAMLPILTIGGLQIGLLLSGAILTETVFALPGLGTWLQGAIQTRDYPVLQAGILVVAVIIVLVNLLVDVLYSVFDPRIRLS